MTLSDMIDNLEDMARQNDELCKIYYETGDAETGDEIFGRDANQYHQIAEWLRELKKWRALRDSIFMLCDVDCEYPQYRESGTMCDACPIGTVKEYFEQIFDGEVSE